MDYPRSVSRSSPRLHSGSPTVSSLHKRRSNDIKSETNLFADDTSPIKPIFDLSACFKIIEYDLCTLLDWAGRGLVTFNPGKTVHMVISLKEHTPN